MKSVVFRPLRRIKKTNKITVASYMQWRNIKTADYNTFSLVIDAEYKRMPAHEFVFDHAGQQLFWLDYDLASIPIFNYSPVEEVFNVTEIHQGNHRHAINWNNGYGLTYRSQGMDCDGVPTFSHYTADYVADNVENVNDYQPLTVGIVVKWFGWFLYELQNSRLQIGKTQPSTL